VRNLLDTEGGEGGDCARQKKYIDEAIDASIWGKNNLEGGGGEDFLDRLKEQKKIRVSDRGIKSRRKQKKGGGRICVTNKERGENQDQRTAGGEKTGEFRSKKKAKKGPGRKVGKWMPECMGPFRGLPSGYGWEGVLWEWHKRGRPQRSSEKKGCVRLQSSQRREEKVELKQ